MHCANSGHSQAHNTYSNTPTTQVTAPSLSVSVWQMQERWNWKQCSPAGQRCDRQKRKEYPTITRETKPPCSPPHVFLNPGPNSGASTSRGFAWIFDRPNPSSRRVPVPYTKFTIEMDNFERQIRNKLLIYNNQSCQFSDSTPAFWDV